MSAFVANEFCIVTTPGYNIVNNDEMIFGHLSWSTMHLYLFYIYIYISNTKIYQVQIWYSDSCSDPFGRFWKFFFGRSLVISPTRSDTSWVRLCFGDTNLYNLTLNRPPFPISPEENESGMKFGLSGRTQVAQGTVGTSFHTSDNRCTTQICCCTP